MSRKYLGDRLDVHTGGPDNKFPHHECEIAQSEAVTGEPFARFWIHCGRLEVGGRKMSKREGTLYTLPDLLAQGYDGPDVRLFLLRHHYRAPIPFDLALLDEASKTRAKLNHFVHYEMAERPEGGLRPVFEARVSQARGELRAALESDLNTSAALAALHEFMTAVNRLEPSSAEAAAATVFMREADAVFDVLDEAPTRTEGDAEIDALVAERDAARAARDFARADEIRDALAERDVELLDGPEGTRWRRR
jgi:cysteinyl-tRNA synthetase